MITTFYFRGKILKNKYLTFSYIYNRVGGTGLIPVPTSHTTIRAVRHTAVP